MGSQPVPMGHKCSQLQRGRFPLTKLDQARQGALGSSAPASHGAPLKTPRRREQNRREHPQRRSPLAADWPALAHPDCPAGGMPHPEMPGGCTPAQPKCLVPQLPQAWMLVRGCSGHPGPATGLLKGASARPASPVLLAPREAQGVAAQAGHPAPPYTAVSAEQANAQ